MIYKCRESGIFSTSFLEEIEGLLKDNIFKFVRINLFYCRNKVSSSAHEVADKYIIKRKRIYLYTYKKCLKSVDTA